MFNIPFISSIFNEDNIMMNFLLYLISGVLNYIIFTSAIVAAAHPPQDPGYWIGVGLVFLCGYGLSILRDIRKKVFSIKYSAIKFFTSLFLCYIAYVVKSDFTPNVRLEYYVFACSLCSLYIVDLIEQFIKFVGEIGFQKAGQLLLQNVLSSMSEKTKSKEEAE